MKCITCTNDARPGQLLCEQCRVYAQELEDLRLRLPPRVPKVAAGIAITLALLPGCAALSTAERAKVASDIVQHAPAACLVYQATSKRTPEADAVCAAIQRPCEEP